VDNRTVPVPGYPEAVGVRSDTPRSAVSWAAIAAGAVVAASTSLLLIALGAGIGLAAISPWAHAGVSAGTFTVMTAIGLIVVQWVSAGLGGYVAGRLRTKWTGLHTHEVFFRDTAHGFITWATATLLVFTAAAAIGASSAGTAAHATSALGAGAAIGAASRTPAAASVDPYDVDVLLRSGHPDADSSREDERAQATRILAKALTTNDVPAGDRAYLTQLVSVRAGVSPADAQSRVDGAIARMQTARLEAQQAADAARRAAEKASLLSALAMLIGAFIACISAALGGRLRDLHA
jgi:hypothetical protein